ncbi:MAG: nitrogenase component 1 [Velocimicrobium sp.]
MEQIVKRISTYSADWAGVCSALYELGGMIVIHDASGCNSTYTTFDEPRWYEMDSMFFISGLTEMDAILGNEEKLVADIEQAANSLSPAFIAIVGSPIPSMLGTDFEGLAAVVEARVHIPTFGFATNGMNYYCQGGAMAFERLAQRLLPPEPNMPIKNMIQGDSINILGVTPLDFSINGNVNCMRTAFEENGIKVQSVWAMGSTISEICEAKYADVNLVVSSMGIQAARYLEKEFDIPYVVGAPIGTAAIKELCHRIKEAKKQRKNQYLLPNENKLDQDEKILVIGEQVLAAGICYCIKEELGYQYADVLCPLKTSQLMYDMPDKISKNMIYLSDEKEIEKKILEYTIVIADPMYQPIIQKRIQFVAVAHEAFSSRIYRKQAPLLIGDAFSVFIKNNLKIK